MSVPVPLYAALFKSDAERRDESAAAHRPPTLLELLAQLAACLRRLEAAQLVRRGGYQRRNRNRLALVVGGDHREEAAVGMAHRLRLDVLGHHLDADLHRGAAGVVDAGEEGDQLADMDRLA